MLNKIAFALIRGKQLNIRVVITLVLIFSSLSLVKKERLQLAQLKKLKSEKQLAAKISEFKIQIASLEKLSAQTMVKKIGKNEPVLQGILIADNVNYAIIDNVYYQEGDDYGEYSILRINLDFVIIENKNTKEQRALSLP